MIDNPFKHFCKDCRHYEAHRDLHVCLADGLRDPVDGDRVGHDCYDQRAEGGRCGHEARLFEPKPTPGKEAA